MYIWCVVYISYIRWDAHYSQIGWLIQAPFLFIIIRQHRLVVCAQNLNSGSLSDLRASYSTSISLSSACLLTDLFLTVTLLFIAEADNWLMQNKQCFPGCFVNWLSVRCGQWGAVEGDWRVGERKKPRSVSFFQVRSLEMAECPLIIPLLGFPDFWPLVTRPPPWIALAPGVWIIYCYCWCLGCLTIPVSPSPVQTPF